TQRAATHAEPAGQAPALASACLKAIATLVSTLTSTSAQPYAMTAQFASRATAANAYLALARSPSVGEALVTSHARRATAPSAGKPPRRSGARPWQAVPPKTPTSIHLVWSDTAEGRSISSPTSGFLRHARRTRTAASAKNASAAQLLSPRGCGALKRITG